MFKAVSILSFVCGAIVLAFGIKGIVNQENEGVDMTTQILVVVVPTLFFWMLAFMFWKRATQVD